MTEKLLKDTKSFTESVIGKPLSSYRLVNSAYNCMHVQPCLPLALGSRTTLPPSSIPSQVNST